VTLLEAIHFDPFEPSEVEGVIEEQDFHISFKMIAHIHFMLQMLQYVH